ncbi:SMI1/KNR4 family protein [Mesobacillus foraminis]|uniref:SMI1/KNR4 family protein n=1 Tax=Mesobacillus foraminis TaxID=279826 RepID=UPI000EF48424|nr:SMI1/KNR4 family protein [Mesobacillus foraminis]
MKAIESIKINLKGNTLRIDRGDGYVENEIFNFYSPASKEELNKLPEFIPKVIIDFLKQHNGADLFVSPKNGGGTHFFSVEEILEHIQEWECPEFFIPFGTGLDGLWIAYQLIPETGGTSVWAGEFIHFDDEFHNLNMDFKTWLEKYIEYNGDPFWEGE